MESVPETILELLLAHRGDRDVVGEVESLLGREKPQRLPGIVQNQVFEILVVRSGRFAVLFRHGPSRNNSFFMNVSFFGLGLNIGQ